jgi:hypothetical protein
MSEDRTLIALRKALFPSPAVGMPPSYPPPGFVWFGEVIKRIGRHLYGAEWSDLDRVARDLPPLPPDVTEDNPLLARAGWLRQGDGDGGSKYHIQRMPIATYEAERKGAARFHRVARWMRDRLWSGELTAVTMSNSDDRAPVPVNGLRWKDEQFFNFALRYCMDNTVGRGHLFILESNLAQCLQPAVSEASTPVPEPLPATAPPRGPVIEQEEAGSMSEGGAMHPPPKETDGKPAMADPYKSGLPGKPTIKHLVLAEFERRAGAGDAEKTLEKEAAVLRLWASKEHREASTPSARTIENQIRPRYRELNLSDPTK